MAHPTTVPKDGRLRQLFAAARPVWDQGRRVPGRVWLAAALLAAALGVAFHTPLWWMVDRWVAPDSYYSHGFFVPLVVLWVLWRDREGLAAARSADTGWGLLVLLGGLCLLLLSGLQSVFFTGLLGLLLVGWGLLGFFYGRRMLRRLLFPLFILTFMVPLPLDVIENISVWMKKLATSGAVGLTELLGIIVVKDGAKIYLENGAALTVGNACSGLRSLIAFLFLGVIFAYLSSLPWRRRLFLILSAIPIALAANMLRVFMLCLVANFWGEKAVEGTVHDSSGYVVFIPAFLMLYGMERLLAWRMKPPAPAAAPARAPAAAPGLGRRTRIALALLAVSAGCSCLFLYPTFLEESHKASRLPLALGGWSGFDAEVEDYVKQILETSDIVERNYLCPAWGNAPVQMAVAFSQNNRRVAHPPEICYSAAGWETIDKRAVQVEGLPTLMRLIMDNKNRRRDVIFYFFKSGEEITANYYRQQWTIAFNQLMLRAKASSLIRFSSTIQPNEDQAAAEKRLIEFIRVMTPEIKKLLI